MNSGLTFRLGNSLTKAIEQGENSFLFILKENEVEFAREWASENSVKMEFSYSSGNTVVYNFIVEESQKDV